MRMLLAFLAVLAALLRGAPAVAAEPVGAGYSSQDKDERGLWMRWDEEERKLKSSSYVITDPALNAYVQGVLCKTVGAAQCQSVRTYIMRNAHFNASMAPNGMMQVWSGLLLRARDEAELAAILGHEYTHYANKHSLRRLHDIEEKAAVSNVLGFVPYIGGLLSIGTFLTVFSYSRSQEAEADSGGLTLMVQSGYDPMAAAQIWEQRRVEIEATAVARDAKPRYGNGGVFASHPNDLERMKTLRALAEKDRTPASTARKADDYRKALAPWWPIFIDDQIKLNDFGGTELLLGQLAKGGWTPDLLFARGELYRTRGKPDDLKPAADFYRQALASADAPVEAWRGLGLALLRSGAQGDGQAALKTYVAKKPDAPDKAMMTMLAGG